MLTLLSSVALSILCTSLISLSPTSLISKEKSLKEDFVVKTLYDSDDNRYCLYEYKDKGYKILNEAETVVLEESDDDVSPYYGVDANNHSHLMYYGPMNYYVSDNVTLKHTITDEKIPASVSMPKIDISKALMNVKTISRTNNRKVKKISSYNSFYVENSQYLSLIENFDYNREGTCGYLAAALSLYYCYRQHNASFISEDKITRDANGNPNGFTKSLHDELVSIGQSLGVAKATDAFGIEKVMKKYATNHSLNYSNYAQFLSFSQTIDDCIRNNKPCVLFGNFQTPEQPSRKVNHAVTLYGISEETFTGVGTTTTNRYFCVNFGWASHTSVRLLDNFFLNRVGSFYNINP